MSHSSVSCRDSYRVSSHDSCKDSCENREGGAVSALEPQAFHAVTVVELCVGRNHGQCLSTGAGGEYRRVLVREGMRLKLPITAGRQGDAQMILTDGSAS